MHRPEFADLLKALERLSPHQLKRLSDCVGELEKRDAIREVISLRGPENRGCPHCAAKAYVRWGSTSSGEQRYRCTSCEATFTTLTGTRFAGLHDKRMLLELVACMAESLSVRKTASRLKVHRNTAFRLRHLMLPHLEKHQPNELSGVAEMDDAFFRESFKGCKCGMPRKSYSRGSPATKRGISSEQIPVLTALSRGMRTCHITVLPPVPTTTAIADALNPVVTSKTVLCADSARYNRALGETLGIKVKLIPPGKHSRGRYHIQNANALHSRMRRWFFPFRGVATKYLAQYLAWFRFFDRHADRERPRHFLLDALGISIASGDRSMPT
jgi:transposase-like protein